MKLTLVLAAMLAALACTTTPTAKCGQYERYANGCRDTTTGQWTADANCNC